MNVACYSVCVDFYFVCFVFYYFLVKCDDTSQALTSQQKLPRQDVLCNCEGPCICSTRAKCRCEGPNCLCGLQRAAPVTSRKASDRSSTETSVFDFPDSDPEMAVPASVGGLRRNRKPPSTDTQQVSYK
jgi:hypothetical protein